MHSLLRGAFLFALLVSCVGLGACAPPKGVKEAAPRDPGTVAVFRGETGERATLDDVVSASGGVDVVLIGENHGHPTGLATAAAVWRGVLERCPNAALSMEFLERDEQAALDDYLRGLTTEEQFMKATGRTAGNYPAGHRAMVQAALGKSRPVIAANAPRVYVRTARADGYARLEGLTPLQRSLFRIPDVLPTGRYHTDFVAVMNGMSDPPPAMTPERTAQLDAMFRSQSLWDWTMADSVAKAAEAGNGPVVHVIGRFHTDFGGGTVQAVKLLRPGATILTISFVEADSVVLRDEDKGRADFVVYAGGRE